MSSRKTEFNIRPNSACGDRSWRWLFAGLLVISFSVAIRYALLGYWLILPFTILEMGVFGLVIWLILRNSNYVERVIIEEDRVLVQHLQTGKDRSWEFPLYWTQVRLDQPPHQWYPHRLLLGSKGEWVEIGQCLTCEERRSLAAAIGEALTGFRQTPHHHHA
jgi:uncharacterized membrane protein